MNDGYWLVERRMTPVRHVDVEVAGRWWPGVQHAWRMYEDGTGWRAAVRFVTEVEGLAAHDADLPTERVRERTPEPERRRPFGRRTV